MALPKLYQYKVYSPTGTYLGMLRVKNDFTYNQVIGTTFVQIELELPQTAPDELTVNDNLIKVWEISPYHPGGIKVFDGYISKWKAVFGGNGDSMLLTCISHGQDASQYIVEGGDSAYINQTTEDGNWFEIGDQDAFGQSYTAALQTFTVPADTEIGAVDVMVSTLEAADLYVSIRQRVGGTPDLNTDPTIMTGHISLASGLVKSVQHVAFSSPSTLVTGTTYYIAVMWQSTGVSTCKIWRSASNPYANGQAYLQVFTPPATWAPATAHTTSDLYFVIYQHGGSVSVTYTDRDPSYMLTDLMASYTSRGGLIQTAANPITPIFAMPFTGGTLPGSNWGAAFAQTFTPPSNVDINIAQLFLGQTSGATNVTLQLCKGDPSLDQVDVIGGTESYTFGGSNMLLATSNTLAISNSTPRITGFSFPTPVSLIGGQQYYILVEFGAVAGLLFKTATSADTVPSPFGQLYYVTIPSNNTSGSLTFHSANPAFYLNLAYELPVPGTLAAGYADTGVVTSYTFKQQTMLRAIQAIASLAPANWYWYVDPADNSLHFQEASATADIKLIQGRHIEEMEIEATKETIKNVVYFTGGDDGTATNTSISVKRTVDVGLNRVGLAEISDNRVEGAGGVAVAITIADDYLNRFQSESHYTTVTVLETTIDTSLFHIGMMVGFMGFGNYVDNLLLQIVGITKRPDGVDLQLGVLPVRTSKSVADIDAGLAYLQTVNNPSTPS